MFFKINKGDDDDDDVDVSKMTVTELVKKLTNTFDEFDKEVAEAIGFELTKAQKDKALLIVEELLKMDKDVKNISREMIIGYKHGITYGMALAAKISSYGIPSNKKQATSTIKKVMTMPMALKANIENWEDTKWFENLMKNAIISDPNKKKNAASRNPKK